jgi:SAM-dependent methyltransferase
MSDDKHRKTQNSYEQLGFHLITGREWKLLDTVAQQRYVDQAFQYWRRRGFPYRDFSSEEIRQQFCQISAFNPLRVFLPGNELASIQTGLALANHFHPQMWTIKFESHRTPMQCFNNDELLKACLRQALNLWPDRKGADERGLRDMLRTFRHTRRVSNFRPTVAKALYEKYSKPGDRILDFSAGYGGRLLGCLPLQRYYVGYDPCQLQIDGLNHAYDTLRALNLVLGEAEFRKVCAEDEMLREPDQSYELVFTSPPYFNREQYSSESSQSFIRYPAYTLWRDMFLKRVIFESYRILKPKGFFIINVANLDVAPIASDTIKLAKRYFRLHKTYQMRLNALPFHKSNGREHHRYEPIFVFQKCQ